MLWYLYILECEDGSLYTGITDNLKRRFDEHASGKGGIYTGRNHPQKLLYHEIFENRFLAGRREKQIKGWSKAKKESLIAADFVNLQKLSISHD